MRIANSRSTILHFTVPPHTRMVHLIVFHPWHVRMHQIVANVMLMLCQVNSKTNIFKHLMTVDMKQAPLFVKFDLIVFQKLAWLAMVHPLDLTHVHHTSLRFLILAGKACQTKMNRISSVL